MSQLVTHAATRGQLEAFQNSDHHALLLVGPIGSGKESLSLTTAATLLNSNKLANEHPYIRIVRSEDGKALGIEQIREVTDFLKLKVPGQAGKRNRAVIIPDAHTMTIEAQNALLKTLEEPPVGSALILTATTEQGLLPTIASRTQSVTVKRLPVTDIHTHFTAQGHSAEAVKRAYQVSGGLIGLMHALLNDEDHPLVAAIETARQLLQKTSFERLAMVDGLAKQAALSRDTLFVLQQMAHVSLQSAHGTAGQRWQNVLRASYEASQALNNSGQAKLVLTNFMLHF